MRPASYIDGMYPLIGQPLYPELWRGCVGAWAPCLGPTGLTLRDWSGYGNHASLTGMDAGTDWVGNQGRYALDFDGSNDAVVSSRNIGISGDVEVAIAFWIYPLSNAAGVGAIGFGAWGSARSVWGAWRQTTGAITIETGGGNSATNASAIAPINRWTHVVIQKTTGVINTTSEIVINGVRYPATGSTGVPNFFNSPFAFGRWADFTSSYINAQFDDVRVFNRVLKPQEMTTLASRRGIAYDLAPRRRSRVFTAGGFKAYWASRKATIIGGGL